MSFETAPQSPFLTAPPWRIFVATAAPMTALMLMSGAQGLVDAVFLGHFVGAEALAAVSLVFPLQMVVIAVSALVGGGMSSLLARALGAGHAHDAAGVFARAHGFALAIGLALALVGVTMGGPLARALAGPEAGIAAMAASYLAITLAAAPVQLWLGVQSDAGRNEGRAGAVALVAVAVTLANVGLDYLTIGVMGWGVAGSAWATAAAQVTGLLALVLLRLRDGRRAGVVPMSALARHRWTGGWGRIAGLGAPLSLGFVGTAIVASVVLATLRLAAPETYAIDVAAYGVVTRVMGFAFLPIMALAMSTQSLTGQNIGARAFARSDGFLRRGVLVAAVYCTAVSLALAMSARGLGAGFGLDGAALDKLVYILHRSFALFAVTGVAMVLALYFQGAGKPLNAAALTLLKPFLLTPLALVTLVATLGVDRIWWAFPLADAGLALMVVVVVTRARRGHAGFGLTHDGAHDDPR